MTNIDVSKNRRERNWTRKEQAARIAWAVAHPLFAFSPRPLWGWRCALLRLFGAKIGHQVHIFPSVKITIPWHLSIGDQCAVGDNAILYALGRISIGSRSTISQGAHICAGTHDLNQAHRPLVKAPITIGTDVWVAADAFIGPGISIGPKVIVGARSVVVKSIAPGLVVAGNPARRIREI